MASAQFIIIILVMVLTFLGSIAAIVVHGKRTNWEDWHLSVADCTHSGFVKVSPAVLGYYRLIVSLFCLGVNIAVWTLGASTLEYYTIWNFIFLNIYFFIVAFTSLYYMVKNRRGEVDGTAPLGRLGVVILAMFEVSFSAVWLVDVVFWAVLFPQGRGRASFTTVAQHALNLVVLWTEAVLNRLHMHAYHVPILILWAVTYAMFTWILNHYTRDWPYFFLDITKPASIAWYVGLLLAHVGFFYLAWFVNRLKARCQNAVDQEELKRASIVPNGGTGLVDGGPSNTVKLDGNRHSNGNGNDGALRVDVD